MTLKKLHISKCRYYREKRFCAIDIGEVGLVDNKLIMKTAYASIVKETYTLTTNAIDLETGSLGYIEVNQKVLIYKKVTTHDNIQLY